MVGKENTPRKESDPDITRPVAQGWRFSRPAASGKTLPHGLAPQLPRYGPTSELRLLKR
jgi:hypothetical protein